MRIHIDNKGSTLAPDLLGEIVERLEALNVPYEDIYEARVTLRQAGSLQAPHHATRIELLLGGRTLAATHAWATPHDAVSASLDAIARRLQAWRRQHSGVSDPRRLR